MNDLIAEKLKLLPDLPGVYRMYDASGELIYVGKAVNLKNRVRQYFHSPKSHTAKVQAMVSRIENFEIIVTANETEALTLESNFIKQYRPHYNILLKDDKHFPYVRIDTKQDFPCVEVVRKIKKDGALYLGPYLSAISLRDSINTVREHFPIRHCRKDINKAIARRERPCLMYHVNKCCAPCSGNVTREQYHSLLDEVAAFLQGDTKSVLASLTEKMQSASDALEFERAALYRDRIKAVEALGERQQAILTSAKERDIFALAERDGKHTIYALFMRNGKVIGTERFDMLTDGEPDEEIMASFIKQYYAESTFLPREIFLNVLPAEVEQLGGWLSSQCAHSVKLVEPKRGENRKLVEMAQQNAQRMLEQDDELARRSYERKMGALVVLTGKLGLDEVPRRIECYDNSHIQGRDTVGCMVVFIDAERAPKEYRRFKIKLPTNGDDYLAMREMLTRRLQRAKDDDAKFTDLPDLIIVDGGRGQLNVALEVLAEMELNIPAIGLAESEEHIILPDDEEPLALPRGSAELHFVQRVRDEAHRFAITYHRSLRQKNALFSVLDEIPGVGDKRRRALFDAFVSMDAIKAATAEELAAAKGMNKPAAEAVYNYFHEPVETDEIEHN